MIVRIFLLGLIYFTINGAFATECFEEGFHNLMELSDPQNQAKYGNWEEYNTFNQISNAQIIRGHESILSEAFVKGDSHAKHLKAMGMEFKPVVSPPIEDVVRYYDKMMLEHVRAGRIQRDEVMRLARVYQQVSPRGKVIKTVSVPIGNVVPKGFRAAYTAEISSEDFYKFISKGHFPMGDDYINNAKGAYTAGQSTLFM